MPWGVAAAGISAAGALGSAAIGASAAGGAAQDQINGTNTADSLLTQNMGLVQANYAPFISTGTNALGALATMLGLNGGASSIPTFQPLTASTFQSSPGYQFQLNQGLDAILNNSTRFGGPLGGNTLKALQSYGTGLANQDWYNANKLNLSNFDATLAGQDQTARELLALIRGGEDASTNLSNADMGVAGQIGSNAIGAGNAAAAGTVGAANSLASGTNTLATLLQNPNFQNLFSSNNASVYQPGSTAYSYYSNPNLYYDPSTVNIPGQVATPY